MTMSASTIWDSIISKKQFICRDLEAQGEFGSRATSLLACFGAVAGAGREGKEGIRKERRKLGIPELLNYFLKSWYTLLLR